MNPHTIESSVRHCYSTWSESYYDDYYGRQAAYPPVHRDLLKGLLIETGAGNVLDAGCGPASFLRELGDEPIELYGFDLTPEMVAEAHRVLRSLGRPPRIWEGSVLEPAAFFAPVDQPPGGFDAVVCSGVLPHVPAEADAQVFANLRGAVKPGGLVIAEARNELFSLFTLNRYSYDFVVNRLVQADRLRDVGGRDDERLTRTLESLRDRFRMDLPMVRRGKRGEPGYDEVLSRTHNPFVVKQQLATAGLDDVQVLFYHYHCLPPMFEAAMPHFFREQSLALEDPHDWRGHFMASAFIVTGRRA